MTIEDIQVICKRLNAVTEDIKWENHLCFNVGGKMFLITSPDEFPPTASIKVSDEDFNTLPSQEGIIPAPYLARHKWVRLDDIGLWSKTQWEHYCKQAYELVAKKLPAKKQKELKLVDAAGPPPKKNLKKTAKKTSKKTSRKTNR